jgi:hypothetical protein
VIRVPGQLAEQGSIAARSGFELQNRMVYSKAVQEFIPYFFCKRFGSAYQLIGHLHVAGKGDAGGTYIPGVQIVNSAHPSYLQHSLLYLL